MGMVTGSLNADTAGIPPDAAEPLSGLVAGGVAVSPAVLPASATRGGGGVTGEASALDGGRAGAVSAEVLRVVLPASATMAGGGVTGEASALDGGRAGAVSAEVLRVVLPASATMAG